MLRVTSVFTGMAGAPYYSTHYFGGDTSGEASAAVTAVDGLWDGLSSELSSQLDVAINTDVEVVDPVTGLTTGIFPTAGGGTAFTGSGDPLPPATQLLIRWRTGQYVSGREIRGRTFVPGFLEAASSSGRPDTAMVGNINTLAASFLTASAGAGALVVYSPTRGQAADVTAASVWTEWAVLRSRRD